MEHDGTFKKHQKTTSLGHEASWSVKIVFCFAQDVAFQIYSILPFMPCMGCCRWRRHDLVKSTPLRLHAARVASVDSWWLTGIDDKKNERRKQTPSLAEANNEQKMKKKNISPKFGTQYLSPIHHFSLDHLGYNRIPHVPDNPCAFMGTRDAEIFEH
jgi:hypothetical protein